MNQRWLSRRSNVRAESARRELLARQAELRQLHPDWPAERVRAEAGEAARPAAKRVRKRRNEHGRHKTDRRGRRRCDHDRNKYVRPQIPHNAPPFVWIMVAAIDETHRLHRFPDQLDFRFESRGERDEAVWALLLVYASATCVMSQRIGYPSKREPGEFEGLTVDHHLAPRSGVSESRIERAIGTLKDWGWEHFKLGKNGRRLCAQPIDENEDGSRSGRAAIHVWAPEFWRAIGISRAALLKMQQDHAAYLAKKKAAGPVVKVEPVLEQLDTSLGPISTRPRPPP